MSETKDEFKTTTSNWSDNIEDVIKDIGDHCKGYKWMNIIASKKASNKYNILMYTMICLGPVAGILSAIDYNQRSVTLETLITIFSFVSGILSAVIKFSKYEQKSSSYKTMASKYASLESNIRRQLSLSRNERVNAGEYLQWVSISYENLFAATPLIANSIYKEWVEIAKQNKVSIPPEINSTVNIQANNNHIEDLTAIQSIPINKLENNNDSIEVVVQGHNTMKLEKKKRSEVYNTVPDLNRYADSAMRYEMRRLYNNAL